jgi:excisionase family DNA binding protein
VSAFALPLPAELVEAIAERAAELVIERLREPTLNSSPWFSLKEAAEYLGISERQVQRLIERGRLHSTTIGRRSLVHREELDRAATREETAPTAPPRRRSGVG